MRLVGDDDFEQARQRGRTRVVGRLHLVHHCARAAPEGVEDVKSDRKERMHRRTSTERQSGAPSAVSIFLNAIDGCYTAPSTYQMLSTDTESARGRRAREGCAHAPPSVSTLVESLSL